MSQTEKTNNHESKIAARKKSIIDAAVQLFSERDFHEVRIDDIAEKVGLAKGTIYLYFENKDQLFLSIIIERTRTLKESLEKTLTFDSHFLPCLEQYIHTFISWFDDHEPFFKMMYSEKSRTDGAAHQKMHAVKREVFQGIFLLTRQLLQMGQEQKVIRQVPPVDQSKVLLGILNAFLFHRILVGFHIPIEEEVEKVIDFFINGAGLAL